MQLVPPIALSDKGNKVNDFDAGVMDIVK